MLFPAVMLTVFLLLSPTKPDFLFLQKAPAPDYFSDPCPDLYKKTGFVFPLRKGFPALHHFPKLQGQAPFPTQVPVPVLLLWPEGKFYKKVPDHYLSDSLPYECVFQYKAPFPWLPSPLKNPCMQLVSPDS